MPTPTCTAPSCDQPSHDAHICWTCTNHLTQDLKAAPDLAVDLDITITKQDRIGDRNGPRSSEIPLPYRPGAADILAIYYETYVAWTAFVYDLVQLELAGDTIDAMAGYLLTNIHTIRQQPDAGTLAHEISYATDRARQTIDKPPILTYLGPCECSPHSDLYAHPSAIVTACELCGTTYTVRDRREWLLKAAEDQLRTATDLSRALPNLIDEQLTAAMIRGWAHRGRLARHPPHPSKPNDPTYRVGDVVDLLHRTQKDRNR